MRLLAILLWCLLCTSAWGQVFLKLHDQHDNAIVFVNLVQVQSIADCPYEGWQGTLIMFRGDRYTDFIYVRETLDKIWPKLNFAHRPRWTPEGDEKMSDFTPQGTVRP